MFNVIIILSLCVRFKMLKKKKEYLELSLKEDN